jgi:hypothetical protein
MLKNPKMKIRTNSDFDADSAKSVLKEAFARAMKNLLPEAEINYVIREVRRKDTEIMKIIAKKKYFD